MEKNGDAMNVSLFSEPFSKTGNISADGFRRLLGGTTQNIIQTVLRESIQNSIDAAKLGRGPSILIRYRTLTAKQQLMLKDNFLKEVPNCPKTNRQITISLNKNKLRVLEICDFETTGLGGPTDGDAAVEDGESLDFVNFIRNVGVTRDTYQRGGTYGYGKTSLYLMSNCSTILMDSQTTFTNNPIRRFMGCHLGSAFDFSGKKFTGRHWWGIKEDGNGIGPLTNEHATLTAKSLGMPERGPEKTGTSILIIDPYIDDSVGCRTVENEIIEAILWNFWPRLTEDAPNEKRISIKLEIENEEVLIPKPEFFPPLDLFSTALSQYRNGNNVEIIKSLNPKRDLGYLTLCRGMRAERTGTALDENSNIPGQSSHIALMRPVELVVTYIKGEPFQNNKFEWAGVFVCSENDEIEKAFAMSEPPTHDNWIPDMLTDRNAKIFVRGALRRINEHAKIYANPQVIPNKTNSERGPSLAGTASRLGAFLEHGSSKGPGKRTSISTSLHKRDLQISSPLFVRLEISKELLTHAVFEAILTNDMKNPELEICAESYLLADGAATDNIDLPADFETNIVSMSLISSNIFISGSRIRVGTESGVLRIIALCPRNAAIGLRLNFAS